MRISGKDYLNMIEEMTDIASYYALAKKTLLIQSETLSSGSTDVFNPYYVFIDRVNHAFLILENIYKEILNNEFFVPCDKYWWQLYYKEREYLNLKIKAMKAFLKGYHEEN